MDWDLSVNKKDGSRSNLESISLGFLHIDAMWPVASCSCLMFPQHDDLDLQTVSQTHPFHPFSLQLFCLAFLSLKREKDLFHHIY